MLVSISWFTAIIFDFQNGGRPPSWILIFSHVCQKFKCTPISTSIALFGEDRMTHGQIVAYFQFSKWRPSAILELV